MSYNATSVWPPAASESATRALCTENTLTLTVNQRNRLAAFLQLLLVLPIGLLLGLACDDEGLLMLEHALKDARLNAMIVHVFTTASSRRELQRRRETTRL